MTCPVPRESDTERILRWLGYTKAPNRRHTWLNGDTDPNNWNAAVIDVNQDRLFLPGKYPADPQLDYQVLQKVRTLAEKDGWECVVIFLDNLETMWEGRGTPCLLAYLPGDYAEAARFLWEGE